MSQKRMALISVFNKEGIVDFAKALVELDFSILSSGGTAKVLAAGGVEVQDVASLVGGGAILGHRVVTLSREVHAGLLARDNKDDRAEMAALGIPYIDLVCVDFYPLEAAIAKEGSTPESVLEATDIGGPTMVRSAAKGRRLVICDPADRKPVLEHLRAGELNKEKFRISLAAYAEYIVSKYCLASAAYWGEGKYSD